MGVASPIGSGGLGLLPAPSPPAILAYTFLRTRLERFKVPRASGTSARADLLWECRAAGIPTATASLTGNLDFAMKPAASMALSDLGHSDSEGGSSGWVIHNTYIALMSFDNVQGNRKTQTGSILF